MEISYRLLAAADFVRHGAYLIDVGTDHAYLPIYLCESGKTERALACDVNDGPCERARSNVSAHGLSDKIDVMCTDGLCGICFTNEETDIVIAGMGGALIAEILSRADFIKNGKVRLILQPMRNVPDLREYLCKNGFEIIGEKLAREDERIYEIICAEYRGTSFPYTPLSLLLGEKNIENKKENAEIFAAFCDKTAAALIKKICGMKAGGADASSEETLLSLVLKEKEV